jgi:hypothetical protein
VTTSAQADTHRAIRTRRVFYRWLWLVYAPLVLGFIAVVVFLSGAMPGFLALPFVVLLAIDALDIRLIVERRRRKIPLAVPRGLLVGVGATVAGVAVGAVLAWMGVDRLSTSAGPALLVAGGFLILVAAFAPAFKLLDVVLRLVGRTLLRLGNQKGRGQQPAPGSQPRSSKAA